MKMHALPLFQYCCFAVTVTLLHACGGGGGGSNPPPTVAAPAMPATPSGLSPGTTSAPGPVQPSTAVTLSWTAVSGATLYLGGLYEVVTGASLATINTAGTSASATLTAGKQYRWSVEACNSAGCSAFSTNYYLQAPVSAPTVSVSVSAPSLASTGQSFTVAWSSTNATSCTASGDWSGLLGVSGTLSFIESSARIYTFTLACSGSGGNASTSAMVNVSNSVVTPTVSLAASATSIPSGQSSTLTWSSSSATSCTASGAWAGTKPTSGTQLVSPPSTATYTLDCTGSGGTASKSVTVTVTLAAGFTSLYSFKAPSLITAYEENPTASLIQGADGFLYGTTTGSAFSGNGTVFKISLSGVESVFFNFDNSLSQRPLNNLILATDGNFYGITVGGGYFGLKRSDASENCDFGGGCGTVFKITPSGQYSLVYEFRFRNAPDGANPYGGLVQGPDGNFYGTTTFGGDGNRNTSCSNNSGCGVVFKITPAGVESVLHSFATNGFFGDGSLDGGYPQTGLVAGTDGNFYGTTQISVFRVTRDGVVTTLASGLNPSGPLLLARDGNFYGLTSNGGTSGNGTVYKLTPSGVRTTLYSFAQGNDGGYPIGALIQASDGNFYGATKFGGPSVNCNSGCGTLFKVTPAGAATVLHSFSGLDGHSPAAALFQASDGNLYGTTSGGGQNGTGTVFRFVLN